MPPDETSFSPVVGPNEGDALWFFGSLTLIKAEGADYAIVEQLFPCGVETPLHVQPEDDETFHVLAGEVMFFAGDGSHRASPGSAVHVAKGTPHGFRGESEVMRMLDVTTPQHVAFFRAAGEQARELTLPPPAEPDMEKLPPAGTRSTSSVRSRGRAAR